MRSASIYDTTLQAPRTILARDGTVIVYDAYDHALKAFSRDTLRWSYRHRGAGPNEIANAMDFAFDAHNRLVVSDAEQEAMKFLRTDGTFDHEVKVKAPRHGDHEGFVGHIVVLDSGIVSTSTVGGRTFVVVDPNTGRLAHETRVLVPDLAGLPSRYLFGHMAQRGRVWVLYFPFTNIFVRFTELQPVCAGTMVDAALPDTTKTGDKGSPVWSVSATVTDSATFLLAKGIGPDKLRIVDEYDNQCRYRGSVRLPNPARSISVDRGVLYFSYFGDNGTGILGVTLPHSRTAARTEVLHVSN